MVNPLVLTDAKILVSKSKVRNIIVGEIWTWTLQITLFLMCCKIILNFKVVFKGIIDPAAIII